MGKTFLEPTLGGNFQDIADRLRRIEDGLRNGPIATVSALPPNPTHGQIIVFQTLDMAAFGIRWQFQYNANAVQDNIGTPSPYKWEFVGGGDWISNIYYGSGGVTTTLSATPGTWSSLTNSIPQVTPLGGDWSTDWRLGGSSNTALPDFRTDVRFGAAVNQGSDSSANLAGGSTATWQNVAAGVANTAVGNGYVVNVPVGSSMQIYARSTTASPVLTNYWTLVRMRPVRVG